MDYKTGDRVVITESDGWATKGRVGYRGEILSSHPFYFSNSIQYLIRFPKYKLKIRVDDRYFKLDKQYYREKRFRKLLD
ncbi:MAG: hypothetical protein SLAVMIC_00053 [uncultured marine phage]|uniref:Uncharacterized protein n=1 Tax=uncultured marine phage TaxID=707152 RepID=A0A8D9C8A0_9VIRU|nr:MAG: hypothetical protein SLAVMIC_00053 [uncultured marine phage]